MPSDAIRVRIELPEAYDMELQSIRRDRKQGEKIPSAESVFWDMMEGYLTRKPPSGQGPSRIEQYRSLRREKRYPVSQRGDSIIWTKWEDVAELPLSEPAGPVSEGTGVYVWRLPKDLAEDLRDVGSMLRANVINMGGTPIWDDFPAFVNQAVQAEIDFAGESVRSKKRQESINQLKKDDEEYEKVRKDSEEAARKLASEKKP